LYQATNDPDEDFSMPRIIYAEQNGTRHEVELPDGVSVMQGAIEHAVPGIDGDCGGECACGTCHVYVDSSWLDRLDVIGDAEASMLSFADGAKPNSRLACQIKMSNQLDGLVVELPEAQH
jgi:2Fe-2S ferredoxin